MERLRLGSSQPEHWSEPSLSPKVIITQGWEKGKHGRNLQKVRQPANVTCDGAHKQNTFVLILHQAIIVVHANTRKLQKNRRFICKLWSTSDGGNDYCVKISTVTATATLLITWKPEDRPMADNYVIVSAGHARGTLVRT